MIQWSRKIASDPMIPFVILCYLVLFIWGLFELKNIPNYDLVELRALAFFSSLPIIFFIIIRTKNRLLQSKGQVDNRSKEDKEMDARVNRWVAFHAAGLSFFGAFSTMSGLSGRGVVPDYIWILVLAIGILGLFFTAVGIFLKRKNPKLVIKFSLIFLTVYFVWILFFSIIHESL